jgi:hypothetical protein
MLVYVYGSGNSVPKQGLQDEDRAGTVRMRASEKVKVKVVSAAEIGKLRCTAPIHSDEVLSYCASRGSDTDSGIFSNRTLNPGAMHGVSELEVTASPTASRRKLLVCHDMRGGYLQDRYNCGSEYENAYQLFHWDLVDMFCYFSHNFITVPPKSWGSACRAHRVNGHSPLLLGTLITEWAEGRETCSRHFENEATVDALVDYLVCLSARESIDGWLINIENELGDVEVENILVFLRKLTRAMKTLSAKSQVIW